MQSRIVPARSSRNRSLRLSADRSIEIELPTAQLEPLEMGCFEPEEKRAPEAKASIQIEIPRDLFSVKVQGAQLIPLPVKPKLPDFTRRAIRYKPDFYQKTMSELKRSVQTLRKARRKRSFKILEWAAFVVGAVSVVAAPFFFPEVQVKIEQFRKVLQVTPTEELVSRATASLESESRLRKAQTLNSKEHSEIRFTAGPTSEDPLTQTDQDTIKSMSDTPTETVGFTTFKADLEAAIAKASDSESLFRELQRVQEFSKHKDELVPILQGALTSASAALNASGSRPGASADPVSKERILRIHEVALQLMIESQDKAQAASIHEQAVGMLSGNDGLKSALRSQLLGYFPDVNLGSSRESKPLVAQVDSGATDRRQAEEDSRDAETFVSPEDIPSPPADLTPAPSPAEAAQVVESEAPTSDPF